MHYNYLAWLWMLPGILVIVSVLFFSLWLICEIRRLSPPRLVLGLLALISLGASFYLYHCCAVYYDKRAMVLWLRDAVTVLQRGDTTLVEDAFSEFLDDLQDVEWCQNNGNEYYEARNQMRRRLEKAAARETMQNIEDIHFAR